MLQLVLRTLVYFRNLLVPVALGVSVASAVIVGALVVGDSMRGSLRFIAMDRIGSIQNVLIAPRWFDENLSDNIRKAEPNNAQVEVAVFVQQAIAEQEEYRASEMSLLGVEPSFWELGTVKPKLKPSDEQVILNQSLAEKLHANVGDLVTLRVASQAVVPADSPLGKREQDTTVLPRWKVIEILPDSSLARFSLRSDQRPIMNAFVSKSSLQKALEIESKVNAIFVAEQGSESLLEQLQPSLSDLGLRWEHVVATFPATSGSETNSDAGAQDTSAANSASTILDYYHLTTDQMLITNKLSDAVTDATSAFSPAPVLTYLANGVQKLDNDISIGRNVPYSTISAVDWRVIEQMLGPDSKIQSNLPDAVVITSWLADELKAGIGDKIRVEYFLPETVDGEEIEKSIDLTVAAIAPLTEPSSPYTRRKKASYNKPPTPFNDAAWTPVVPGITDQESISKWDTPFPLSRTIEPQDDTYWNSHRLTPKLYVSKATGVKLFGSRFGDVSSVRFDGLSKEQADSVETSISLATRKHIASLGWHEIPLRAQQLRAASGTTPFDALFLSLSFFVIVAALLLVALLFRLAIEQRADHWGLLMAAGWTRKSVRRLLLLEGAVVSGIGAALGVLLGLGYAYAMIVGLRTWWVGAITVSFLDYHAQPLSLALGWLLGWLSALATIVITTRQLKQIPIAKLLKRQMESTGTSSSINGASKRRAWLSIGCVLLAIAVLVLGQFLQGQAQAGDFVGAGMLFLIGGMAWIFNNLKSIPSVVDADSGVAGGSAMLSASTLASSNAKRAPMRSILAVGLVAIASFLILSMSLFQSAPNEAGTGGFAYVGKSTHAIYIDLNKPEAQREVLGPKMADLKDLLFVPMRVRGGDDASCNNLYQASEPQVLGVSARMDTTDRNAKGRSAFAWFATGKTKADRTAWSLLETQADGTEASPLPVILDQNTALWALHLGGYVGERFSYTLDDRKVFFQTVGVLQNTILQGSLIIGEDNFEKVFPSITGYRSFLVKSKIATGNATDLKKSMENSRRVLEDGWAESGLSFASSDSILSQLLAVQNTYLGAFQVLGGLGLLLGTIGLGVAQLRSALERRGELAAMRAIGFTKSRLVWLLTLENGWQLLRGVGVGVGAAALATLPAILNGQPFSGLAWPCFMLLVVLLSGMICSILAAVGAMRWPLLASLRSDR